MKNFNKFIFLVLIFFCLIFGNVSYFIKNADYDPSSEKGDLCSNEILGGLLVVGRQGWQDLKTAGYCSGFGNSSHPYIIKDLHINGQFTGSCLTIQNSDVHFVIRNCTMYNSIASYDFGGIFLDNTTNGDIFNNTLYNNGCGIYLEGSPHNYIHNNTVRNNSDYGLCIRHNSDNNRFSENKINHNSHMGIYHDQSENNTFSFNSITDHPSSGIYFMYNDNITIINNYLSRNTEGINLNRETHHSKIINNTLEDNSLSSIKIGFTDYCYIYNNIIRNPQSSGINLWNSKYNIVEENYVYSSLEYGIMLDRARYNTIRQNIFEENQKHGIYVTDLNDIQTSIYNEFISNKLVNNGEYGIYLEKRSNYNKIKFNNLTNNQVGCIYISGNSIGNELLLNLCDHEYLPIIIDDEGYVGITWSEAIEYNLCSGSGTSIDPYIIENININAHSMSHGIEIVNSTAYFEIRDCKIYQSKAGDSYAGIVLNNIQNGIVTDNEIIENSGNGIILHLSNNNIIKENVIAFNSFVGIKIGLNSDNNLIHMNNFTSNYLHAQDFGIGNSWNSSIIGNYWDDYIGLDMNEDGIGDTPYYSGNVTDYLPIWYITIAPKIIIIYPNQSQIFGFLAPAFELDIETYGFEILTSWYCLNFGDNYTFTGMTGFINQSAWDTCGNGSIIIRFCAKNIIRNVGYSDIEINKDIYFPSIEIHRPEPYSLFGNQAPYYNITVITSALDSMWYTLNNGPKNFINEMEGTIDQDAWEECGNGTVIIKFFANNTYGEVNFEEITLMKDSSSPNITIHSPIHHQIYGIGTIFYNVTIYDPKLNSTWYTLNGGEIIFFDQMTGLIDHDAWQDCGNGTVIIAFLANNSVGNIGSAEILVYRDIFFPFIQVHTPVENQSYGLIAPSYNFSVSTSALDTMWYTLNNGPKNFINETEGTIDQDAWEECGNGTVIIKFFANNTYSTTNFEEVIIQKVTNLIERNAYAIIIGISNYPGSDYDLSYCDDDAIAVYNMLIDEYNFKPENIIYLQDSVASKNGIDNAFNTISSIINPEDIFYFYYSGHGGADLITNSPSTLYIQSPHPYPINYDRTWWISSTDAAYIRVHFEIFDLEPGWDYLYLGDTFITEGYYYQGLSGFGTNFWSDWIPVLNDNRIYLRMITDYINGYFWGFRIDQIQVIRYSNPHYLCSYDSIPSSPGNYYLDSLLDSRLDSLNCDNKYVILDSCNSGGMIPESQDTNRFVMTACKGGQFSMEEPALNHGIFTYYLLNSLDNANDQNGDGVISMEEIFSYVSSGTRSYSASYGPGIQYHPQLNDGIDGQSVLYPSIGSVSINPVDNRLYYSFYLYGHGFLKTLNLTVCSISPTITFKTEEVKNQIITPTGFGYYSGFIELEEGYVAGGIQLLAEIEGNRLIVINFTIGDSDGDGLTDFFEILQGGGLDPNSNDTDSDGLNDYDEFYGPTDPLDSDTDSDGLLDGEEVNIYGTDPVNNDTDSDGLTDYEEVITYNTNPLDADSDSDDLLDGDEINIHFTDPLNNDTDSDYLSDGDEVNIYTTNPLSNDTDSDWLTDYEEVIIYNTDPLQEDTDSDGLTDYEEVIIYNTDPLQEDSDSDGLTDGEEVHIYGTDPLNNDTDLDTMPDGWEVEHSLDPLFNDTALDPDNDLLTNLEEYQHNTNPQNPDTDDDGLLDGEEVNIYNTDPLQADTDSDGLLDGEEVNTYGTDPLLSDTDSDGLSDGEEVNIHGTDPLSGDTDSDTMPDKWEVDNLLDPLVNDTALDPDNDLLINILEYQHSTDPQNPDTDGDGWTDGDEVLIHDTDPLDPDSHPSKKSEAIPGYTIGLLLGTIGLVALFLIKKYRKSIIHN